MVFSQKFGIIKMKILSKRTVLWYKYKVVLGEERKLATVQRVLLRGVFCEWCVRNFLSERRRKSETDMQEIRKDKVRVI